MSKSPKFSKYINLRQLSFFITHKLGIMNVKYKGREEGFIMYQKLMTCLSSVKQKIDFKPEVALVLGSGLGDYADGIKVEDTMEYAEIDGFPVSTVKGHKGRFVFGYVGETPVVIMQGRVHYYEGYPMSDVVLPSRLMGLLGVPSPLIGPNIEELGTRFPDMSEVYSNRLKGVVRECAADCGIDLKEGVYVQFTGPSYETPAEIRLARSWGADAVGMSTACEAMAARPMGLEVCGISCITNLAAGLSRQELNHKEVQETADRVAKSFKELVTKIVTNMA